MSSALGMNLMPPTSAFQHGGGLQQPPAPPPPSESVPQPQNNSTNNANASELNNSTKDNHHGKTNFTIFFREIETTCAFDNFFLQVFLRNDAREYFNYFDKSKMIFALLYSYM